MKIYKTRCLITLFFIAAILWATLAIAEDVPIQKECEKKLSASLNPEPKPEDSDVEKKINPCTEPRPQICTQDYRPVCAELNDGSSKTYSNGCTACSDPAVTWYRKDACE